MTDEDGTYGRRSVLKMTGTGLAVATGVGVTGSAQASHQPDAPNDVYYEDRQDSRIKLNWDFPDDDDREDVIVDVYEYECDYGGCSEDSFVKSVETDAYLAPIWIENLRPGQYYGFHVYAVDEDGYESEEETTMVPTEGMWEPVHTADGWTDSTNELGGDWSASGFRNGSGTVTDDGLELQYDEDGGVWDTFISKPDGDGAWYIDDYENRSIKMLIHTDEGVDDTENADLTWNEGTETGSWDYYAIGQDSYSPYTVVTTPLEYAASYYGKWSVENPERYALEFHKGEQNQTDTFTIESVWVSDYPDT